MALQYRLEFLQEEGSPADDSVFIHLRSDVPAFRGRIGKEAYSNLDDADKSTFMDGLFEIDGITEASSQAFRVWIMKSPAFTWPEVLNTVLEYLRVQIGEDSIEDLPGSGKIDGTGFRLDSSNNRRSP